MAGSNCAHGNRCRWTRHMHEAIMRISFGPKRHEGESWEREDTVTVCFWQTKASVPHRRNEFWCESKIPHFRHQILSRFFGWKTTPPQKFEANQFCRAQHMDVSNILNVGCSSVASLARRQVTNAGSAEEI